MHGARVLWAMGVDFSIAYIAPAYLDTQIVKYATALRASGTACIGLVEGAPNVVLIAEAKEVGDQGYDMLLRQEQHCIFKESKLRGLLAQQSPTDIIVFPGKFDLESVLAVLASSQAHVHIDIAYDIDDFSLLKSLCRPVKTVFASASSPLFLEHFHQSLNDLRDELFDNGCSEFIFKENRGGSRLFLKSQPEGPISVGAQVRLVTHSVGIGDAMNVAFLALMHSLSARTALTYATWLAAEYASTTQDEVFVRECKRVLAIPSEQIVNLAGVVLPWEVRPRYHVYVAAPDFDFADRVPIEQIAKALKYHNFTPRLPIRENGQMPAAATPQQKGDLFSADIRVLKECKLVLAVLTYDDPGTLIEIGLAVGMHLPTIVYDPYSRANNLMLTELPQLVSSDPDEVISRVFELAGRWHNESGH